MADSLPPCGLYRTVRPIAGVDAGRLVYFHKGRPERLTLNEGEIYAKIMGV